ncbi:SusC/RagA family TonB-linked outer membrane protein [Niabella hirudinis]|uniref:SusC/RagA family TonB-linked outer membrane protein n=1 Tax=Niabella hirudinis TaxID=1285929 RepID=UPI003EBC51B5
MKLVVFIVLLTSSQAIAINTFSQDRINLKQTNTAITAVLKGIEQEYDYRFVYSDSVALSSQRVDIWARNATIDELMQQLLRHTSFAYKRMNQGLIVIIGNESEQADLELKGTVTDETGIPLAGVNIVEKGTTNGTVTLDDGSFAIKVKDARSVLILSSVGYTTRELPAAGLPAIIALEKNESKLTEVVVVGYGTQKKVNLSGAVAQVGGKDLVNRPTPNVTGALQGVVPGLTVLRSSGKPGAEGLGIRVRGATSANNADALVLVDGLEQDINLVDPNEVESISVLKDASASAIYGARAAAGVILITTKKAAAGKTRITLNSYYGLNISSRMPERLTSWDEQTLIDESRRNATGSAEFNDEQREWLRNPNFWYRPNPATDRWEYFGNTDWIKEGMDKINHMQNHALSVGGGTEKLNYIVMGSFYTRDGVLRYGPDNNYRYNLKTNINAELSHYLSMKINLGYVSNVVEENSNGTDNIIDRIYRSRTRQGLYTPDEDTTGQRYNGDLQVNPIDIEKNAGMRRTNLENLTGRLNFQVKNVIKGLTLDVIGWRNQSTYTSEAHNRSILWYGRSRKTVRFSLNVPNSIAIAKSRGYQNNLQSYLTYNTNFGEGHHLTLMQGASYEEYRNDQVDASAQNMINNDEFSLNYGDPLTIKSFQTIDTWAMASAFGRLNYSFKNRYLLEASYRYDGSSRLAPANRWQVFPSFSGAWRIGEEEFVKNNLDFVSELKLRGSWGQLGNGSPLGLYPYMALLTNGLGTNSNLVMNNTRTQYIYQSVLESPSVTWETVQQSDIGLEMGLFRNKLSLTADYYVKKNKNMLASLNLPSLIGIDLPSFNVGELKSWGYELELKWRSRIGAVDYNIGMNFSDNQNKLLKYEGRNVINTNASEQGGITPLLEGYPLNTVWGYRTNGYFQSQEEADAYRAKIKHPGGFPVKSGAGDVRYVDVNGDNEINVGSATPENHGDLVYLGTADARYAYGFNLGLNWKSFDFSVFFQGVLKRKFLIDINTMAPFVATSNMPWTIHMDRWTPDNPDATFPRMYQTAFFNYLPSDKWAQNGNYLRLKNLQIGYKVPVKKHFIKDMRIYVSGQDLWETTKVLSVFDPEVKNGVGAVTYPFYRTLSFGTNLLF